MPVLSTAALLDAWLGSVIAAAIGVVLVLLIVKVLEARGN